MCRFRLSLITIFAFVIIPKALSQEGARIPNGEKSFIISKETTRISAPVDKDGLIDYAAALNDHLSAGVTTDNNAMVLLCRMFGPKPDGVALDPAFYKRLGIEEPAEKGEYFVTLDRFLEVTKIRDAKKYARLDRLVKDLMVRPWRPDEFPEIASWLKSMEGPIARGVQGTYCSKFYHPLIPQKLGIMTCSLVQVQECRKLADALVVRAALNLGEGRLDAAWRDLAACYRLARLVSCGGSPIEKLVGIDMDQTATKGTLGFLGYAKIDAKQLHRVWNEWQQLPPRQPVSTSFDICERFTMLEAVIMVQRYGLDGLALITGNEKPRIERVPETDWNPALRNINAMFDRIIKAMDEPDYKTRMKKLAKLELDIRALKANVDAKRAAFTPVPLDQFGEGIGNILVAYSTPSFTVGQRAQDRGEQIQRNLSTAFALAAYRCDHGTYPDEIGDLSPKYLEQTLPDLFTGKNLIYRPQAVRYVLYSVGVNGKDDGGRSIDDEPAGDDLVVRMPPKGR